MPFWFDPHPVQTEWQKDADILLTARSWRVISIITLIYQYFVLVQVFRIYCVDVAYSAMRHHFT